MAMQSLLPPRLRVTRRAAPLEAFSRTEKVIAFCRVLLATGTFALVIADPLQPSFRPNLAYLVLGSYFVFSVVLFALIRGERVRQDRIGYVSAAIDVVWVSIITLFMESGATPFFVLHVFVISSVSIRWGLAAAVPVTVLLAGAYPVLIFAASHWLDPDNFYFGRAHLFRPLYLLAVGYLIGYLGEYERRSKRKLGFLLDLTAPLSPRRQPGLPLVRIMRRGLGFFDAQHGLVMLRDPESGRYFTWSLVRGNGPLRLNLRITNEPSLPLPFAGDTEGFLANDLRPGRRSALCYDVATGTIERRQVSPDVVLPDPQAQALLMAPILIRRELRGRAIVARTSARKFTRDDLEFLLVLVGQAAAAFESTRLLEKAEEVAVLEERARIARDLHDGFIQALAGIDLRIQACKTYLQRDPERVPRALEEVHTAVDTGYREVRHYLTVLRSASRQADDLGSTLDRLAAEFAIRERVLVHMARPAHDPKLPASTAYEITQIVREALHNAVRHGKATQAVVKLASRPSHVYLVVRDNGRGFPNGDGSIDPDGFLKPASTPWSIRERTAALGGSLRVWTEPGRGSEVSLLIPVSAAQRSAAHQEAHA
jgi:signal transduction histidine kinase